LLKYIRLFLLRYDIEFNSGYSVVFTWLPSITLF